MARIGSLKSEVGLTGFEAAAESDFGDAGYSAWIPDPEVDPAYDLEH